MFILDLSCIVTSITLNIQIILTWSPVETYGKHFAFNRKARVQSSAMTLGELIHIDVKKKKQFTLTCISFHKQGYIADGSSK